jgi:hypothetical protein
VRPDQLDRRLRAPLDALGAAPHAELLTTSRSRLRARRGDPVLLGETQDPDLGELLIDWRGGPDAAGGVGWDATEEQRGV